MQPHSRTIFALFDSKRRYVIPMFQRQYVWSEDRQWAPLWADIERKAIERLSWSERVVPGREPDELPIPHFLGAIVIDLIRTYGNEVQAHTVIDGQQRLTTFQLFLAAFRDVARKEAVAEYADEVESYIHNTGVMANRSVELYKVWPTNFDQDQYKLSIDAGALAKIQEKYAAPRSYLSPRMIQGYAFFYRAIEDFVRRPKLRDSDAVAVDAGARIKLLFETLQNDLELVSIELSGKDDPQVIFETLNARGEPLLPSDLLRNYLFWKASRERAVSIDDLYNEYWKELDSPFWKVEEKQGRLKRPRIDLFLQNFLQAKRATEVNVGRLFYEYKEWSQKQAGYQTVSAELRDIHVYAGAFKPLLDLSAQGVFGDFVKLLHILDVKTVFPFILWLKMEANLSEDELLAVLADVESYLVRRMICGLTPKNYNNVFLGWIAKLKGQPVSRESIRKVMGEGQSDTSLWPSDARFKESWINAPLYSQIKPSGRLQYLLRRLEQAVRTKMHEQVTIQSGLTIEHVMPEAWIDHWPLRSGEKGRSVLERFVTPSPESTERDQRLHTIGNLTLLTSSANPSLGKLPFLEKRQKIEGYSLLALNSYFAGKQKWDEDDIQVRAEMLFAEARGIWPHPN